MDTQAIIQTLTDWQKAIRNRQQIHFANAHRLEKLHYAVGLPATILAAVTSATIFTKLNEDMSLNMKFLMASVSLVAGIFAAVQTFYSFAKRSETNRSIAAQLGQVDRQTGILILFLPTNRAELEQKITKLNEAIFQVTSAAPTVELPRQALSSSQSGPSKSDTDSGGGGGGSTGFGHSGPIIMSPPDGPGPVRFT
jgi:hypothetical protein